MSKSESMEESAVERAYWDAVAEDYESRVTSVFDNDAQGLVHQAIAAAASRYPNGRAADLGCGVGKFLPLLSNYFASVEACDWSAGMIAAASEECSEIEHTRYHEFDLSQDPAPFDPVDFVLCVNVLIMPDLDQRLRAWRAVTNQTCRGGTLLLVAPSHESAQMEQYQDLELRLEEGQGCAEAARACLSGDVAAAELQWGVFSVGGVRIKHYLLAELEMMLATRDFRVERSCKIVYPRVCDKGIAESWDWLVEATRL